jgi:hypothetical protein
MTGARILKKLLMVSLGVAVMYVSTSLAFAQPKASFQIFIPRKVDLGARPTSASPPQIGIVKANVTVSSASPVVFTITDADDVSRSFTALTPAGTKQIITFPNGDPVAVSPNVDAGNPNRYEIEFVLRSISRIDCTGNQAQPRSTYRVEVRATDPKVTGVCLDSYDGRYRSVPLNLCGDAALGTNLIPIPLDDPADKVASLHPSNQPTQRCASFLPAPPPPPPPNNIKIVPRTTIFLPPPKP